MTTVRKLAVPTDDTPEERVLGALIILDIYEKEPPTTDELATHLATMNIEVTRPELQQALARLAEDRKIKRSRRRTRGSKPVQVWRLPHLDL